MLSSNSITHVTLSVAKTLLPPEAKTGCRAESMYNAHKFPMQQDDVCLARLEDPGWYQLQHVPSATFTSRYHYIFTLEGEKTIRKMETCTRLKGMSGFCEGHEHVTCFKFARVLLTLR